MPQSYASLNYHIVFSTKDRVPVLTPELLSDVYTFIGSVLKARGGILVSSGGVTDHIHLLVDVSREASLSQTVRDIKSLSSGWIHRTREDLGDFAWQPGYGAFTVGYSQVAVIKRYLRDQVSHHRNVSFKEEYIRLLKDHGVRYNTDYPWD